MTAFLLLAIWMAAIRAAEPIRRNHTWIFGTLFFFTLFLLGAVNILCRKVVKEQFALSPSELLTGRLVISDNPEIRAETVRAVAGIMLLDGRPRQQWLKTKAVLNLPLDDRSKALEAGDVILLHARFLPVPGPSNPGEFDYGNYLSRQDIDYQVWAGKNDWKVTGSRVKNLKIAALHCRSRLLDGFRAAGMSQTTTAVLSALTLGYKADLEQETTELFTRAGIVHIMALSGFNVGLIFMMVNLCLGFLPNRKTFGFLRLLISLAAIWSFAIVTGLSPSVTRASIMISLFLSGKFIQRTVHPLNSLAASAFLILVFSPSGFTDAGFQLSYTAVLGLIYIQPRLYRLLSFRYWLPDKVWMLFTVSVAAQLSTMPLTLYYFHQFPLFFWITNLYAVPLVSLIIYGCVPFFVFFPIGPVRDILAGMLEFMTRALLLPLEKLKDIPGALMEGLFVGRFQVLLLFVMLAVAAGFLVRKRMAQGLVVLAVVLSFLAANGLRLHTVNRQQIVTVNSIRGTGIMNIVSGRNNRVWCFSGRPPEDRALHYALQNWWIKQGVYRNTEIVLGECIYKDLTTSCSVRHNILGDNVFLCISGIRFVVCTDDVFEYSGNHQKIGMDYVVITETIKPAIKKLLRHFDIGTLIIDSSVGYYESKRWSSLCSQHGINCWPVRERGAFVVELGPHSVNNITFEFRKNHNKIRL